MFLKDNILPKRWYMNSIEYVVKIFWICQCWSALYQNDDDNS